MELFPIIPGIIIIEAGFIIPVPILLYPLSDPEPIIPDIMEAKRGSFIKGSAPIACVGWIASEDEIGTLLSSGCVSGRGHK